ncbi:MAG TPA: acetate--CoA ligase family protein [Actinomycetota bacterium]|nr:acetate--CoA ligase family protein [Actinomycetota bacterium]
MANRNRLDVSGRPVELRDVELERFFNAQVIAVVGASDSPGKASTLNYRLIRDWSKELGRRVYAVNPNRDQVDGEPCYSSVIDVPEDVDVVVILVSDVVGALRQAIAKKAPFAVIFAAGFAESDADGAARQSEIEALIEDNEIHVLGPNTTLNAFQPFRRDLKGKRIGLITQSGHQGRPIYQAQEIGIPMEGWAPTGNEADLESADFIRWFADQPDVGVVAGYIEGFKDGRTLMLAANHALERGVPTVFVKSGRTEMGRSWVQTHAGHLAGSDSVMSAVFRQFGVTRVDGLDELLDVSAMFARCPTPSGDGVAIYSISGGTCTHVADLATARGLRVPDLTEETQARLHEWIPGNLRVSNPVDTGGHPTGDERGPKILKAILEDPNVSLLIVPVVGSFSPISDRLAQDLVDAARNTKKPVCVVWGSPTADEPGYREVLLPSELPLFRSVGNCLTAVKAYLDYHGFRDSYRSPFAKPVLRPLPAVRKVRDLLGTGGALSEHGSKQVLAEYGIPVTRDILCGSAAEAARAAKSIGLPVVMKVSSQALLHKSDLGLVRLAVATEREVRSTFAELMDQARGAAPDGPIEGVLVSELVDAGIETALGVVRDDLFGPTVMFGLGGIAIEVFRDVSFRVPPFTKAEARRMIEETKSASLLRGARGKPKADLSALADAIMKVQRLAMDLSDEIAELDVNPLMARPDGVIALDALVVASS